MIYTVTTVRPNNTRCIGYYHIREEALKAVIENYGDMSEEGYYLYAVVEGFDIGIYPHPEYEQWFQWVGRWVKCEKPVQYGRTVNFGIG